MNEVIRSLQKGISKILVISDEITPKFFGKHLVTLGLSNNQELAIIIVPKLKELIKEVFGISTVVFTVLKTGSYQNNFVDWCLKNCDHQKFLEEYEIKEEPNKSSTRKPKRKKPDLPEINLSEIYLMKTSDKKFQFVPEGDEEMIETVKEFGSDFISFEPAKKKISKKPVKTSYKPLIVRKIQGKPK